QPRASPLRPPTDGPRYRSLRPSGETHLKPTICSRQGLSSSPGTIRQTTAATPLFTGSGLDQSACGQPGKNSINFYTVCLIVVDTFRIANSLARTSTERVPGVSLGNLNTPASK